jgi:hypothetical protein
VRAERETLRQNYQRMEQIAHNRSVQVASLGALANEVSTLYGLRQNKLQAAAERRPAREPVQHGFSLRLRRRATM